jgi:hypothetical protein
VMRPLDRDAPGIEPLICSLQFPVTAMSIPTSIVNMFHVDI